MWVFDHFHTVPTPELEAAFECWTVTSTLARDTKRVKVGQMVGCNGFRNPALYAKIASTVDVASHGKLYAGIGAGWYEHEWRAYGYGFPEARDRAGMLREACEITHKMWTEDYSEFRVGDDMLYGGDGDDFTPGPPAFPGGLSGGPGKDVLYGGAGNDLLNGGSGPIADHQRDELYCGKGRDHYSAEDIDYVDSSCEEGQLVDTGGPSLIVLAGAALFSMGLLLGRSLIRRALVWHAPRR